MEDRLLPFSDYQPVARALAERADLALVEGDRERGAELIARLYDLFDRQIAIARWIANSRPVGPRTAGRRRLQPV